MAGFAIGLPLAVSLGAVMTATLFGVVRPDPFALSGVLLLLVAAAAAGAGGAGMAREPPGSGRGAAP
jgi:hypothetical protein